MGTGFLTAAAVSPTSAYCCSLLSNERAIAASINVHNLWSALNWSRISTDDNDDSQPNISMKFSCFLTSENLCLESGAEALINLCRDLLRIASSVTGLLGDCDGLRLISFKWKLHELPLMNNGPNLHINLNKSSRYVLLWRVLCDSAAGH